MTPRPPKAKVKVQMGQRKSGLAVPAEAVDVCKHLEIIGRIKPQFDRFVCGDCREKVVLVPLAGTLMTEPEFDQFQMQQVLADRAEKRKKVGLVLPDEVRREQQEGKK